MSMNNTISVIIPVYNVLPYLKQSLNSILSQQNVELEVLLIDDGSTDGSGEICDRIAEADHRVHVFHQKNSGAAAAKNVGLRIATGRYLAFVDSDDFLEPNAYSHMVQLLQEHEADVVQCSYRDVFKNRTIDHLVSQRQEILGVTEFLTLFTKDWTCALSWDKLYKRSLFDGIFFETGHKIDDEYFTYRGIMNGRKVVRDNRIVYNYRRRSSSVMFSPTSAQQIVSDRIDYLSKRRRIVIERFPQLRAVYDSHFLNMMVILSRDENATEENIQVIRKHLKSYFHEKEHTKPDYHLFPALARLMFGNTDHILRHRKQDQPEDNPGTFFE